MAIAENVLDAVYKSRKTIIVMSKNFLKSMWGQYELQQAHNKAIVKVTVINHLIYLEQGLNWVLSVCYSIIHFKCAVITLKI